MVLTAGREAGLGGSAPVYVRRRPERTLLYQFVDEDYPAFKHHLEAQEAYLPAYVEPEFEGCIKCGRPEHGFLRLRCEICHADIWLPSAVNVEDCAPAVVPAVCWWLA